MALDKLIKDLESAKEKMDLILEKHNLIIPIFRVNQNDQEHFRGDGFFYSKGDKITYNVGMLPCDTDATPENVFEAYKEFNKNKVSMKDALICTIKELNYWSDELIHR